MGGKRTLRADRLEGYSDEVRIAIALSLLAFAAAQTGCAAAMSKSKLEEENYDLLTDTNDTCKPKIGVGIEPMHEAACKQMTEPRRYRGTWYVGFETSFFTPIGKQDCIETKVPDCVELAGDTLPWPN